jgi:hypothetical protein
LPILNICLQLLVQVGFALYQFIFSIGHIFGHTFRLADYIEPDHPLENVTIAIVIAYHWRLYSEEANSKGQPIIRGRSIVLFPNFLYFKIRTGFHKSERLKYQFPSNPQQELRPRLHTF